MSRTDQEIVLTRTIHQSIPESVARTIGAFEGWNQSFDKLVEALATKG